MRIRLYPRVVVLLLAWLPMRGQAEIIDVMVVFEQSSHSATTAFFRQSLANQIVDNANQSLSLTGLGPLHSYRLANPVIDAIAPMPVQSMQVTDAQTLMNVVYAYTLETRDQYFADVIILVSESLTTPVAPNICGAADGGLNIEVSIFNRNLRYAAVIKRSCLLAGDLAEIVAPHELGHLLSAEHEPGTAPGLDEDVQRPVRYNHPTLSPSVNPSWATAMVSGSTVCSPQGSPPCTIVPSFSNPTDYFPGTQIITGNAFDRNNKRMIADAVGVISRYRPIGTPVVIATPTCHYEYTGCVGTKRRYMASWYQNGTYPFPRGYAQYSTNNGSTWTDLVQGTQAACAPVVPSTNWIIRAFIRTAFGDSAYCYMDILYQPCNDNPPL